MWGASASDVSGYDNPASDVYRVPVFSAATSPARHTAALRPNALTTGASIVMGVASAAPAYSLTVTLGVLGIGPHALAALWVAFLPMYALAVAFAELNAVHPDAGTSFAWAHRFVPGRGGAFLAWLSGWCILATDIICLVSLAQVFADSLDALLASTGVHIWAGWAGCLGLAAMTWASWRGIAVAARVQAVLLALEVVALGWLILALLPHLSVTPSLTWFSPAVSGIIPAVTVAIFMYWGWDTTLSAAEETSDSHRSPGVAAVWSTVLLVVIFLVTAAVVFAYDPGLHGENVFAALTDVVGPVGSAVVSAAVLTSAAASAQTTILPNARTLFSMARHGAAPQVLAHVHPRFATPDVATWATGAFAVVAYLVCTQWAQATLDGLIESIGMLIAFYYAVTGGVCVWHFRASRTHRLRRVWGPGFGTLCLAVVFVLVVAQSDDVVRVLGVGSLLLGVPGAVWFALRRGGFSTSAPR